MKDLMKDLTKGPVGALIISMAAPIMVGMLVQTIYYMVDLYFVGKLGELALAGVSAAGNVMLIVMALTQMLSVGAVSLIARSIGSKQVDRANQLFNQSLLMGLAGMLLTLLVGYSCGAMYLQAVGADAATVETGLSYLHWYLPGLAMQFVLNSLGAGLRGIGIVKPTMLVQLLTIILNIVLAPVLIAGWGTGVPLGVAGAGLATSLAVLGGVLVTIWYFRRTEHTIVIRWAAMRPHWPSIRAMLAIGFPAGAEFACMFLFMAIAYQVVSHFGPHAMAGFGVGARITQALSMPAMAIAFALPALIAQNLGAGEVARAREIIFTAMQMVTGVMLLAFFLCKFVPEALVTNFVEGANAREIAIDYIRLISWNFIASGFVFSASSAFQALGNTWPSLFSTAMRILTFALPAWYLSHTADFALTTIWTLSVASMGFQALLSLLLLRREWHRTQERSVLSKDEQCPQKDSVRLSANSAAHRPSGT